MVDEDGASRHSHESSMQEKMFSWYGLVESSVRATAARVSSTVADNFGAASSAVLSSALTELTALSSRAIDSTTALTSSLKRKSLEFVAPPRYRDSLQSLGLLFRGLLLDVALQRWGSWSPSNDAQKLICFAEQSSVELGTWVDNVLTVMSFADLADCCINLWLMLKADAWKEQWSRAMQLEWLTELAKIKCCGAASTARARLSSLLPSKTAKGKESEDGCSRSSSRTARSAQQHAPSGGIFVGAPAEADRGMKILEVVAKDDHAAENEVDALVSQNFMLTDVLDSFLRVLFEMANSLQLLEDLEFRDHESRADDHEYRYRLVFPQGVMDNLGMGWNTLSGDEILLAFGRGVGEFELPGLIPLPPSEVEGVEADEQDLLDPSRTSTSSAPHSERTRARALELYEVACRSRAKDLQDKKLRPITVHNATGAMQLKVAVFSRTDQLCLLPLTSCVLDPTRRAFLRLDGEEFQLRVYKLQSVMERCIYSVASVQRGQTVNLRTFMPSGAALKVELLDHLEHDVYVKLGVSAVEGCGVIAIRDIPAGVDPFPVCNREALNFDVSSSDEVSVVVTEHDLENRNLHPEVRRLVKSFFAPLTDEDPGREMKTLGPPLEYGVNATGMNTLNVGWYLNHSENPNVRHFEAVEAGTFCTYVTTREIQAGEELFINYKELGPEYYKTVVEGVE
eukprot:g13550.t1